MIGRLLNVLSRQVETMYIPDNIIRKRIENVYFIWGRGKTTIAKRLKDKYGFYIYSTDDSRSLHGDKLRKQHT